MLESNDLATSPGKNDWNAHKIYILQTLVRYDKDLGELKTLQSKIIEDLSDVKAQLAGLKVQSGIWGLIAGSFPVLIAMLIKWLLR